MNLHWPTKDTTRRWFEQDHASMAYASVVKMTEGVLEEMESRLTSYRMLTHGGESITYNVLGESDIHPCTSELPHIQEQNIDCLRKRLDFLGCIDIEAQDHICIIPGKDRRRG